MHLPRLRRSRDFASADPLSRRINAYQRMLGRNAFVRLNAAGRRRRLSADGPLVFVAAQPRGVVRFDSTRMAFGRGDRVAQAKYGSGTVLEVDEEYILIDFDEHGLRKFSARIVSLQSTGEPRREPANPKRPSRKRKPS